MIPFPSLRSCLLFASLLAAAWPARAAIEAPADASPRVRYGIERLQRSLTQVPDVPRIIVGKAGDSRLTGLVPNPPQAKEGFVISTGGDGTIALVGADDSGVL